MAGMQIPTHDWPKAAAMQDSPLHKFLQTEPLQHLRLQDFESPGDPRKAVSIIQQVFKIKHRSLSVEKHAGKPLPDPFPQLSPRISSDNTAN